LLMEIRRIFSVDPPSQHWLKGFQRSNHVIESKTTTEKLLLAITED
jgi:hypothetical protein